MNAVLRSNRGDTIVIVAVLLLLAGLWPITYLASPQWDVWVIDDAGKPLSNAKVRLVYQNYSAEGRSHEMTLVTGESGHVSFPRQYERASFLKRIFYIASSASAGVHASFGRHAYVIVFGDGYEGFAVDFGHVTDWSGKPESMTSKIAAGHHHR